VSPLAGSPLTPADLEKLESCAISPELARQAQLRRVDSIEGGRLVGHNGNGNYAGIIFPNIWPGEQQPREYRLRRDCPEYEVKSDGSLKERNECLSPPGRGNLLYFVPGTNPAWLGDPTIPLVITEGEKNCLSLWNLAWYGLGEMAEVPRWLSVGISGVWNWKGTIGETTSSEGQRCNVKGPIPDLSRIVCNRRPALIVFDRNVVTDDSVATARREFAKELKHRGAAPIEVIDLPPVPEVNGIDDLIGKWGPEKILQLLKTTTRPWNSDVAESPQSKATRFKRVEDLPRLEDVCGAEIEWDLEGLIPRATLCLLTGESGSGKSTLASALAYAVSRGQPFLGRRTIQRPVLILDAENPAVAVMDRFKRLNIQTDEQFRVWGQWTGEDPPSAGGAIVLEWVSRCDPKPMILVDSFIRFHPGAENDSAAVQAHMAVYRSLCAAGASVIVLHNSGKAESAQEYRGSSDIKASCDICYKITNLGDGTVLSNIEMRAFKQRISVEAHLYVQYRDGVFTAEQQAAVTTVQEQLVELLKSNPGILSTRFEKLAGSRGLGRDKARQFLRDGVKAATIRTESEGKSRRHFWRSGTPEPRTQTSFKESIN
jgi:hypothetical protein